MNDKSHVSLEQHVCLVCGTVFDTGAILLDKRLRTSMKLHTATLCPEHQKLFDDGANGALIAPRSLRCGGDALFLRRPAPASPRLRAAFSSRANPADYQSRLSAAVMKMLQDFLRMLAGFKHAVVPNS